MSAQLRTNDDTQKRRLAAAALAFRRVFSARCLTVAFAVLASALSVFASASAQDTTPFPSFDEQMGDSSLGRRSLSPSEPPPTTYEIPEFGSATNGDSTPVRGRFDQPNSTRPDGRLPVSDGARPNGGIPSNRDYRDFQYRKDERGIVDDRSRTRPTIGDLEGLAERPDGVELPEPTVPPFDWNAKTTSAADLKFATSTVFVHNTGFMERQEEVAYLDLITATELQWRRLVQKSLRDRQVRRNPRAEWEEAFYRFREVRRLAWQNGKLIFGDTTPTLNGFRDPFAPASGDTPATPTSSSDYSLLEDISKFPEHFIGRPIVLYGRFSADSDVKLVPGAQSAKTDAERYQSRRTAAAGALQTDPLPGRFDVVAGDDQLPIVPETQKLLRGTLIGLKKNHKIAMVDTKGLVTPGNGLLGINDAWRTETEVPVLVKGWVVKNWKDNRPLIYCESMRLITPRPHVALIRKSSVDKRRLQDEETWLYYETLKQLELTSSRLQSELAAAALQQRIDVLMGEIIDTSKAELVKLTEQVKVGSVTDVVHKRRRAALERRLDQRLKRYKSIRKNPEKFQTYVDMYQHPEAWQGDLVTLRGHVRHVVSYPSDDILFPNRTLHELWLFTDDSQHNPAVIVTPNLPNDFPMDAEVIDYVTVTGCFFKRYVYGSQDVDRIAPLILASNVTWRPTVHQVQGLVDDGLVSAGSPRAVRAAAIAGDGNSQTAMWFGAFLVMLVMMVLWGRAQREERDRVHLRKLVNDAPVFENATVDGYASLLSDGPVDSASEYLSSTTLPTDKFRS